MAETKSAKKSVSSDQYVRIWQTAASLEDAAHKAGITIEGAIARTRYYVKNGVPMRKFRKARPKNDWAALAKLAGELGGSGK